MSAPQPVSDDSASFRVIVEALRHGEDAAWREVLRRYSSRLVGLARSRLFDARLRQKLDPEDVVQSVWRTFHRRHRLHAFDLGSWDDLWGLLITLTVHRVCKWNEHFQALKRSLDRETPLELPHGDAEKDRPSPASELVARTPTPEEVAQLGELVSEKLAAMGEAQRRVIELGLLGYTDAEISNQAGRTEARVRQVRSDFVQELLGLLERETRPAAPGPQQGG
jgi:RNA polymerase sigma-70 factor (ECF subfamily)